MTNRLAKGGFKPAESMPCLPPLFLVWFCIAAFAAAGGIYAYHGGRFLGEGTDTTWCQYALRHEPLATIFFLRARSVAVLPLILGFDSELAKILLHIATALPLPWLLFKCSSTLGSRRPEIAALVGSASVMFVQTAWSGMGSSTGATLIGLALWLWLVKDWGIGAGVVFALIPHVRPEGAILGIAAVVYSLARGDRRILYGCLIVALPYWVLGGMYHRDVLWLLKFTPVPPDDCADCGGSMNWETVRAYLSVHTSLLIISNLTPFLFFGWYGIEGVARSVGIERTDTARRRFRVLGWTAMLTASALFVAPFFQTLTSGGSRTLVIALPFVAIGTSFATDLAAESIRGWAWRIAAAATVPLLLLAAHELDVVTIAVSAGTALAVAAMLIYPNRLVAQCCILLACGASVARGTMDEGTEELRRSLAVAVSWTEEIRAQDPTANIYSDLIELRHAPLRSATKGSVEAYIRFDVRGQIGAMTNPDNGQTAAILSSMDNFWGVGKPRPKKGDHFVVLHDHRSWLAIPIDVRKTLRVKRVDRTAGLCMLTVHDGEPVNHLTDPCL